THSGHPAAARLPAHRIRRRYRLDAAEIAGGHALGEFAARRDANGPRGLDLLHELGDRPEFGHDDVATQHSLSRGVVDLALSTHLVHVIAGRAHRGTPSSRIFFRSAVRPRRCSALTAPTDLPRTSATWSTVRSATTRSSNTSRWSAES